MRIAVVTVNSTLYQPLAQITNNAKVDYCIRHGYSFLHSIWRGADIDASWQKIYASIAALDEGYDLVVWLDCDVAVMNPTISIEEIITAAAFEHLALTADHNGLNTGVFMVGRTDAAREFLYTIANEGYNTFKDHKWQEQEAMKYFLAGEPYKNLATWLPLRALGSHMNSAHNKPDYVRGQYQSGDWLIHLAGLSNEDRFKILKELGVS